MMIDDPKPTIELQNELESALAAYPPRLVQALIARGLKVRFLREGEKFSHVSPSAQARLMTASVLFGKKIQGMEEDVRAIGVYVPSERRLYFNIPMLHKADGEFAHPNGTTRSTMLHEIAHAIDHYLGELAGRRDLSEKLNNESGKAASMYALDVLNSGGSMGPERFAEAMIAYLNESPGSAYLMKHLDDISVTDKDQEQAFKDALAARDAANGSSKEFLRRMDPAAFALCESVITEWSAKAA
jgi:hypothetical protein